MAPKEIKKSHDRLEISANNNNNSDEEKPSPHPDGSSGADRGSGSNNDQPSLDTPTSNQSNASAQLAATATGPATTSPKPLRLSDKFKALFKVRPLSVYIYLLYLSVYIYIVSTCTAHCTALSAATDGPSQRDKKKDKRSSRVTSPSAHSLSLNNANNGHGTPHGKEQEPRSAREKKVTRANCFAELSEELQKKIKKAKLHEDEVNQQFWVLLNVLHFITKESYRMEGHDSPPVQRRRPYAPVKSIEAASECPPAPAPLTPSPH